MSSFDLISMGRVSADLYPQQEGPLRDVQTFARSLGGTAANVAVATARYGHRVALLTKVGDDRFGSYVRKALADFNVDARWVGTDARYKTPLAFAELDPPENPGLEFYREPTAPDMQIELDELDIEAIAAARILWVTGSAFSQQPSRDATLAAMRARSAESLTVLDLDWRPMFWDSPQQAHEALAPALLMASVVVGNREEVAVALGRELSPPDAAAALIALGARIAVVKLGGEGVLIASAEGLHVVAPVPVEVVCGLGAGDAFGGALCHGLLEGWDNERSARFANAAGAYVAGQLACADAMPTQAQVEALLEAAHA